MAARVRPERVLEWSGIRKKLLSPLNYCRVGAAGSSLEGDVRPILIDDIGHIYWFLSRWEFEFGIIGIAELEERELVFQWIFHQSDGVTNSDPRALAQTEERTTREESSRNASTGGQSASGGAVDADDLVLEFIPQGLKNIWVFTKDDADSYPSVPHGHLDSKTRSWPKLNPYTGRAFAAKDVEHQAYRLTQKEMFNLWNDRKFRKHALETIAWYQSQFPYYQFDVPNPRRLPRWRMS